MSESTEQYAKDLDEAGRRFDEGFSEWKRRKDEARGREDSPLSRFPLRSLTWLALAPEWPLKLAQKSGFPGSSRFLGPEETAALLDRMYADGVCKSRNSDVGRGRIFWMDSAQQSRVLDHLKKLPDGEIRGLGLTEYIRVQLHKSCTYMEEAAGGRERLSPPLRRWVELGHASGSTETLTRFLRDRVGEAIAEAESRRQVAAPEALNWIRAAQGFVNWFGEPVEWAAAQAMRQLELFYRAAYDERSLKNYFARPAQEAAFDELLDEPDGAGGHWALHYVGLGGTGKTMLMRHISTRLARERNLAVARVDFDRLNPDYPSRAPGLLLISFAEELRRYAPADMPDLFGDFDRAVDDLHDQIGSAHRRGSPPPVGAAGAPAFRRVLSFFTAAVGRLSESKRVVLILDTCEELAKLRSDNSLPDSVQVTFDILERIHAEVGGVRVVFSGRRPLASAGLLVASVTSVGGGESFLWRCPASKLQTRSYLRLYEIRGFMHDEARQFLERYKIEDAQGKVARVNPGLIPAIIKQSCSADHSFDSRFDWLGGAEGDEATRYNPYELAMFAQWAASEPGLTEKDISAGEHQYVKDRIIKRAGHHLRPLLPGVALLGRFDEKLVRALIEAQEGSHDIVFPELINSEWLDVDRNATESGTVWVVDGIMRKRLLNYYSDEEPGVLSGANETLGGIIYDLTLKRSWDDLSPAYFETALRVLGADPPRAARWWDEVEQRLAREARWPWAKRLTDELLAEEGPAAKLDAALKQNPEDECVLRPAILTTQAAALTHLVFSDPQAERAELVRIWDEVVDKSGRHPVAEGREHLRRRGTAGSVAARRWTYPKSVQIMPYALVTSATGLALLRPSTKTTDEAGVASEIAMLEGIVEAAEAAAAERGFTGDPIFENALTQLLKLYTEAPGWWPEVLPPDLEAFFLSLRARMKRLCGGQELNALDSLKRALELAGKATNPLQQWPDWHRPDDLRARLLLEYVRIASEHLPLRETLKFLEGEGLFPPLSFGGTIDEERLASAAVQLCGHRSVGRLHGLGFEDRYVERSVSLQGVETYCNAHAAFPPLFVSVLEAEVALGRVEYAVSKCLEIAKVAEGRAGFIQQEASQALLSIVVRMRLNDEGGFIAAVNLGQSPQLDDAKLLFISDALEGVSRNENLLPALWDTASPSRRADALHAALRCRMNVPEEIRKALPDLARTDALASFESFSLALDKWELDNPGRDCGNQSEVRRLADAFGKWAQSHRSRPVEALTLGLRSHALTGEAGPIAEVTKDLLPRVGTRRAAGIAFEEGTLLALRTPAQALRLLRLAREWYDEADDPLGRLLATVRIAMLHAQSGDAGSLREMIPLMEKDYVRFSKYYSVTLPPWDDFKVVRTLKREPAAAHVQKLMAQLDGARVCRPWLARMLGCLVSAAEPESAGEATEAVRRWVRDNYLKAVSGSAALPPEFEFLFRGEEASLDSSPRRRLGRLGMILLGWLVLIGATSLLVFLLQRGLSLIYPVGYGQSFLILLALVVVSVGVQPFFRWYRGQLVSVFPIVFEIVSDGKEIDTNRPLQRSFTITVRVLTFTSLTLLSKLLKSDMLTVTDPTEEESYRGLALAVPAKVRESLTTVHSWAGPSRYVYRKLLIDVSAAAAPWEAILGLTSEKFSKFEEVRYVFWRDLAIRKAPRPTPPSLPFQVTSISSTVSQIDLAYRCWADLRRLMLPAQAGESVTTQAGENLTTQAGESVTASHVGTSLLAHAILDPAALKTTYPKVSILHLIGRPVMVGGALRLELDEAGQTPGAEFFEEQARRKSSGAGRRGRNSLLLSAGDVLGSFPALKICVVQPQPSALAARDVSSRYQAGLMRSFGAELYQCGFPAVIVLPALDDDVAIKVFEVLQEYVIKEVSRGRRWWAATAPFSQTVRRMQEVVAAGYEDQEAALELAFDLTLYAVDNFNLNVRRRKEYPPP